MKRVKGALVFSAALSLAALFLTAGWWWTALSCRETLFAFAGSFAALAVLRISLLFLICGIRMIRRARPYRRYRYVTAEEVRKAAAHGH